MKRLALVVALAVRAVCAQPATLTVDVAQPGHAVSPMLWGVFFEDINCSADGGIYAELVRNRSFEDADQPRWWSLLDRGGKGAMSVSLEQPMNPDLLSTRNRRSLKLAAEAPPLTVANDGFWGMGLRQGAKYKLSLWARGAEGYAEPLSVALESADGKPLAQAKTGALTAAWKQYQLTLTSSATDAKGRLTLSLSKAGTVFVDMVSMFPADTYRGGLLRPDMMTMLAELKPAFVRFPGGCWVEGDTMQHAYRWKDTIGDPSLRRTQHNIWNYEATHGLGYHEYLLMCEQLGAEPVFCINVGMSHRENVPMDQLGPYVQDALDAVEYANAPASSRYGALRAKAGHPAPFALKYLEIGNENGGPAYEERYAVFAAALRAKYPDLHLISNIVTKNPPSEINDEHYYATPEFFARRSSMYDGYDRSQHQVFVGEYAVTQGTTHYGSIKGAVGEAAFMTGLERNSDVVHMASYAPLFCNPDHTNNWWPNLIYHNSAAVFGQPSYWVQYLFSRNRGDVVLPVELASPAAPAPVRRGGIGLGSWATAVEYKDIQVTRDGQTLYSSADLKDLNGWRREGRSDIAPKWAVRDGAIVQTEAGATDARLVFGDPAWTDYTLTLKARKTAGDEGFLILFDHQDTGNWTWWNLGGWGNKQHGIEVSEGGKDQVAQVPGSIETGRWYDIRVATKGQNIKLYLDGKLVHDYTFRGAVPGLHVSAVSDKASGDVIVKVANVAPTAIVTQVKLAGKVAENGTVQVTTLSGDGADDANSFAEPLKVAPRRSTAKLAGAALDYTFPGTSVTVLRVPTR